jgi:hypothetical protein
MTFLRLLGAVEIRAVLASVLVAVGLAAYVFIDASLAATKGMFTPYESARITFLPALIVGIALAALYGAPVYAFVFSRGLATWPIALLLGYVPGGVVYLLAPNEPEFALLWTGCSGSVAALATHVSMKRFGRPPRANRALGSSSFRL